MARLMVVGLLVLFGMVSSGWSQTPAGYFSPDQGTFRINETVSVQIFLDTNNNLDARMFFGFIRYATTHLEYVTGTINTSLFDNAAYTNLYVNEWHHGRLSFSAASQGVLGNQTMVANLWFTVLEPPDPGPAILYWSQTEPFVSEIADQALNPIAANFTGQSYMIHAAVSPTPTFLLPTPTFTPTEVAPIETGTPLIHHTPTPSFTPDIDINKDQKIDHIDLLEIIWHWAERPWHLKWDETDYGFNRDLIELMKQWYLGVPTPMP